jgi:hypothetical protein
MLPTRPNDDDDACLSDVPGYASWIESWNRLRDVDGGIIQVVQLLLYRPLAVHTGQHQPATMCIVFFTLSQPGYPL